MSHTITLLSLTASLSLKTQQKSSWKMDQWLESRVQMKGKEAERKGINNEMNTVSDILWDSTLRVQEHYTTALIEVKYWSALHVEENAKRIQLVPKHTVCLCLCTVPAMLIRVDGEVAIPSHMRANTHMHTHKLAHSHTGVKHKVALVNELGR